MALLASVLVGFIPAFFYAWLIYQLDRYEKEPLALLGGVFFWGAIIAAAGAFLVNTLFGMSVQTFTGSLAVAEVTTSSLSAPLVEESLKGLAVLLVFWFARHEFDSILDGIIYAGVTALGFSATENVYYIYQYGFVENGLVGGIGVTFLRVILLGWQHPFYTAFIGIGLAIARISPRQVVRWLAPLLGWLAAVFTHAFHNTLPELIPSLAVGLFFDWSGWLAMAIFIYILIQREREWQKDYLIEEVTIGIISSQQYKTACSSVQRFGASVSALSNGKLAETNRFYQLCSELVHKKHQLARVGDENGNLAIINSIREELVLLAPQAHF